jgi:hypothetical protein
MRDKATCPITRAFRSGNRRRRFDEVPRSTFSDVTRSVRVAARAGARAKQEPGDNRDDRGESKDPAVEGQGERILRQERWAEAPQEIPAPDSEAQTQESAEDAQDETLGQQLANESPPIGSDGQSNRNLALSRRGPSEKQIRHVDAGNQ